MEYRVTWTIEVDAESEEDAARKALAIQRDVDSTATVFEVARYVSRPAQLMTSTKRIDLLA